MTKTLSNQTTEIVVCALYKFTSLPNFTELQTPLLQIMEEHHIFGTLLLAEEGINGTIAGQRDAIDTLLLWLNQSESLNPVEYKESYTREIPFKRTKVKLKKEIVTMGVEGINPTHTVGTYVTPENWDNLINDPEVILIDTRNDYEVKVGSFKNAINPDTETFREFPDYVKKNLDPKKHKKIAMFCTGGIRCEKSTAYLKEQGFEDVYHLKGGILKYLEKIPEEDSSWEGECFVFDDRVTVNHQLEKGNYDQCHACRLPITKEDQQSEYFIQGVSCPYCFDKHSSKQKQRFMEREKQMLLARNRGEKHIGSGTRSTILKRRETKQVLKEKQRKNRSSR